jgi:anti-sigma regulatory factor (Ser/Thr protein kinase)
MLKIDISHLTCEEAMKQLAPALSDPDNVSCWIDFDADHGNSKIIRDFIGQIFDLHRIEHPWKGRFILITDELINNAIEHGSSIGDIDSCIIETTKNMDSEFTITLEVHDTGTGKDAKDAAHMESIRDERLDEHNNADGIYMEKRGRGLFHITEKLVDKLSFSASPRGWLAVKIEKSIPRA